MKSLSSILSQLMAEKDINSAELARATGIGQPVIYRLMTGTTENPQILTLKPIADFFGVSIDELLGYKQIHAEKKITNTSISNKILTAKTIATAFQETLPVLIESYSKATATQLIKKNIPESVLSLFPLNASNLLFILTELQEIIEERNSQ